MMLLSTGFTSKKTNTGFSNAHEENQSQQPFVNLNKKPEEYKIYELIRLTYTRMMMIEILEINDVQSKSTPRP
jgi:hypothetical protein